MTNKFRLLAAGDIIQSTDHLLMDDCQTWESPRGVSVGMRYVPTSMVPIRRPLTGAASTSTAGIAPSGDEQNPNPHETERRIALDLLKLLQPVARAINTATNRGPNGTVRLSQSEAMALITFHRSLTTKPGE